MAKLMYENEWDSYMRAFKSSRSKCPPAEFAQCIPFYCTECQKNVQEISHFKINEKKHEVSFGKKFTFKIGELELINLSDIYDSGKEIEMIGEIDE
jgi:hypothetical protein